MRENIIGLLTNHDLSGELFWHLLKSRHSLRGDELYNAVGKRLKVSKPAVHKCLWRLEKWGVFSCRDKHWSISRKYLNALITAKGIYAQSTGYESEVML